MRGLWIRPRPEPASAERFRPALLLATGFLALCAGCSPKQSRVEHARAFPGQLAEKTARILPEEPLGLDGCVEIALENNLDLRVLEIQQRLAALDARAAFGNFLPNVQLKFSFYGTDNPQLRKTQAGLFQLSDQEVASAALEAQQAIFVPEAWFLYDMRRKGKDIRALVHQRARQQIALQVTTLYFAALSLEEADEFLRASIERANALLRETGAWEREGYAMPSQRRQVETLLLESTHARTNVARLSTQVKAELLQVMGVSPFGEMRLRRETPLQRPPARDLADDVLEALLSRLELHVEDRRIEIRRQEVRNAIAAFLPRIVGVGGYSYSSDSFLQYANVWSYGISAVMSVFDGFQNVFGYRSAREREKEAFLEREQRCVRIMIETLQARHRVEQTSDFLEVAVLNLETAEERLREIRAQEEEGMIQLSDLLDAVTKREQALFVLSTARFQQQVALATLADVLGQTKKEP